MSLRRIAALLFALVAACAKDVTHEAGTPAFVDFAVFDPSTGAIPLPNDLALLPQSVSALPEGPQKDLLEAFQVMGGFPNDQEVDITIDFVRESVSGSGSTTSAPALDVSSIGPSTLLVLEVSGLGASPVGYDVAGYAVNGSKGTLTLRPIPNGQGKRFWEAGKQFIVAVRGGEHGVKTVGGGEVHPQPAMFLLLAGKNLADPANQALLPDPSAGAQLELIRESYIDVFMLVDNAFPSSELAVIQTFKIAPAKTHVVVDQAAGIVPFPSNFLLDYTQNPPRVVNNPAFGPLAPGLATLDGFTTTGMLTATTSAAIDPATVKNDTVFVFRVVNGAAQRVFEVKDFLASGCNAARSPTFVAQPPPLDVAVPTIALQPAVPVPLPGGLCAPSIMLPPLEEASDYVVVVTNRVKDSNGKALGPDTPASLLLFASPLVSGGVPTVPGLDVPTATLLDILRRQIAPALQALPPGLTKADVAFAYPIHTQSITGASLQLAALPFSVERGANGAVFSPVTGTVQALDVTATFGIPPAAVANVDSFFTLLTPTLDAIDQTTGALRPDLATLTPVQIAGLVKPLPAIVAVPKYASVPSCGLPPPFDALHCAKVVVFEHGLGGGHLQTIGFANTLAAHGFIVAAVDFPLHGDRAPCSVPTAATDCNAGGTCNLIPGGAGQGDANPPGICSNGNRITPQLSTTASGRYFVSANFFRIRDSFRQNLIDQSALALSVARPPQSAYPFQPAQNDLAAALQGKGIAADPSAVYVEGISLGSIAGTQVLATSSRFARGALSVGGATEVDVIMNSPSFKAQVDALFINSLGFDRNDPANAARYLQTINVAKWVLDPGDPLNFAKHVRTSPLPDLLSPTNALQSPKDVWGQIAQGDLVVPNPYNFLLYENSAVPFTFYTHNGGDAPHSMLAVSATAQSDAAGWLVNLTNPGAAVNLTDF